MEVTEATAALIQGVAIAFAVIFLVPFVAEIIKSVLERWI